MSSLLSNTKPIMILATGQSNFDLNRPSATLGWPSLDNLSIWNWSGTTATVGTAFTNPDQTHMLPEVSFAAEVAKANPSRQVYLVWVAIDGMPISHWMSGTVSPDIYADVQANVTAALAAAGMTKIDCLLWWQGEADAASPANYVANFETVMNRFKAETWFSLVTPVIIFGIAKSSVSTNPGSDLMNRYLQTCANVACRRYIPTSLIPDSYWNQVHMVDGGGYDLAGKLASLAYLGGMLFTSPVSREVLTADRTYYVRVDGNDANDGLDNSSGRAFLTLQKAINVIQTIDINGHSVTIQVGNGTYTSGISFNNPFVGGTVTVLGDTTTPSNVVINTSGVAVQVDGPACKLNLSGVKLTSSGANVCRAVRYGVIALTGKCEFGVSGAGSAHIFADQGGQFVAGADYIISGAASFHFNAQSQGGCIIGGHTITLTGTPNFSTAFASASSLGRITATNVTFSGAATGSRYSATGNAVIDTGGGGPSYFPGDSAGSTNGGLYL